MGVLKRAALSELIDGELDPRGIEAAIDALLEDDDLASEWFRAHQLRGLLRDDVDVPFDVRAAVRDEVARCPPSVSVLKPRVRPVVPWPRYVWGGALAATVALLVVAGLQPWKAAPQLPAVAQQSPPQVATVAVSSTAREDAGAQTPSAASPVSMAPSPLDRFGEIYSSNELFAGQGNEALFQNVGVDGRR